MKKILSIILVFAMSFSLIACGKSNTCTCDCNQCSLCEKKNHSHEVANTGDSNDGNKIVFQSPVLLVENEAVRVELMGFNQKDSTVKEVTTTKKYIALKIHNKASYEIMLKLENLAVNGEQVKCIYQGYTTEYPRILAGDTTTYHIEISPIFDAALGSMEDLYELKGRVKVGEYIKYQGHDGFNNPSELSFSVADAIS